MMTRDQILTKFPLPEFIRNHGRDIVGKGKERVCCCFFHDDKHPSMRINEAKQTYYCDVCKHGGSVIDLYAHLHNITIKDALAEMSNGMRTSVESKESYKVVTTYEYQDEHGQIAFLVDRLESKNERKRFSQYHIVDGKRVNSLDGVLRVLYRLPKVMASEEVCLVEGEKCVHALEGIKWTATTNPGGSGAWLDAYAEMLKEKHVVIMPDSDEPGDKWLKTISKSLEGKVASLRIIRMPTGTNDIADLISTQGKEQSEKTLFELFKKHPAVARGVNIPVYHADELMDMYIDRTRNPHTPVLDLSRWLPSFKAKSLRVRPLLAGELLVVAADTGMGKSAILQNIALAHPQLTILFFAIELPGADMAERFSAMAHRSSAISVESKTRAGERFDTSKWNHVYVCPESKLSVENIEEMIVRSELKLNRKPDIVMIDYIGLIRGGFGKRYERLSTIAEDLKVLAKTTNAVFVLATQIRRKQSNEMEVGLHDAKDSGSIESSAQLVLGAWRHGNNGEFMTVAVNKATRGGAGLEIECDFEGTTLRIMEQSEYQ